MSDLLRESKEIYNQVVAETKPTHTCIMFSGGDDSLATLNVALQIGVKVDFIIHGNTGTGLPETTAFVRETARKSGIPYIEADAGSDYENYVFRKGFFGKGIQAHEHSYHILKATHFRKAISKHIRKGQRGIKVMLLNGIRLEESENRANRYKDGYYNEEPGAANNVWARIIQDWTKEDVLDFLKAEGVRRSPVSECLGRSGECMCGTMQNQAARMEAAKFSPDWGRWLDGLEKQVVQRFPWRWGEGIPKGWNMEKHGQGNLFNGFQPAFQPACIGCKAQNHEQQKRLAQ